MIDQAHEIKQLLKSQGLRPKDYLGQNFLFDQKALESVVEAANLESMDTILEIGPGLGSLTRLLSQKAAKVVAVEKDKRLIYLTRKLLKSYKNVQIILDDILRFNIPEFLPRDFKVVANIPYYLTSKLIANLLALENKPKLIVLLVQKEVAERITAQVGDLSILGISVQFFAEAEVVAQVPRANFWPVPEVDSAIIRVRPSNKYKGVDEKLLFWILKIAFSGKRKQIHNTLASGLKLNKDQTEQLLAQAGIKSTLRPQDLTIPDWIRLTEVLAKSRDEKK